MLPGSHRAQATRWRYPRAWLIALTHTRKFARTLRPTGTTSRPTGGQRPGAARPSVEDLVDRHGLGPSGHGFGHPLLKSKSLRQSPDGGLAGQHDPNASISRATRIPYARAPFKKGKPAGRRRSLFCSRPPRYGFLDPPARHAVARRSEPPAHPAGPAWTSTRFPPDIPQQSSTSTPEIPREVCLVTDFPRPAHPFSSPASFLPVQRPRRDLRRSDTNRHIWARR